LIYVYKSSGLLTETHDCFSIKSSDLPTHLDGSEHAMTARCRRFANQLHGRYGLPVALVDERLSSAEAEERLSEAGHKGWRKQKPRLDSAAAQIILLQYFESAKHADS